MGASLARAAQTRAENPQLARQARRWTVGGSAAALGLREALGRTGVPAPRRAALLGWCAATAAMLDWHLGMLEGPRGEPRRRLAAADALTLARIGLAPFVGCAPPHRNVYLAALSAAATTDLLDGPLARADGATRLGRDLDAVADLVIGAAAASACRRAGWLSAGAAWAVCARCAVVLAASCWQYFARGTRAPPDRYGPTRWTAPLLVTGLALAGVGRRRAAGALVVAASAGALASASRWRRSPHAHRH